MADDGSNPVALTNSYDDAILNATITQKVPVISPNGTMIAYFSGVEMNDRPDDPTLPREIWVMRADGTGHLRLSAGDDPGWSPDSSTIIWPICRIAGSQCAAMGGVIDLAGINPDGTNKRTLVQTNGGFSQLPASWQPRLLAPPADATPPSTPTNLTAAAVSSSQLNLAWTASMDNVGVTGYRLERCQGSSCTSFVQIVTPTGTSYSDPGLPATTTYRYRLRATDAAGNLSGYSTIASATTLTGGLRGDLTGDGKVNLDDLRLMIYMLLGQIPPDLTTADLNTDGRFTLADLQFLVKLIIGIP